LHFYHRGIHAGTNAWVEGVYAEMGTIQRLYIYSCGISGDISAFPSQGDGKRRELQPLESTMEPEVPR
jgi:hypothetical protein